MKIGDVVIYAGRRYILRGVDPMSVPARRAHLEDLETEEQLRVPLDQVREATSPGQAED